MWNTSPEWTTECFRFRQRMVLRRLEVFSQTLLFSAQLRFIPSTVVEILRDDHKMTQNVIVAVAEPSVVANEISLLSKTWHDKMWPERKQTKDCIWKTSLLLSFSAGFVLTSGFSQSLFELFKFVLKAVNQSNKGVRQSPRSVWTYSFIFLVMDRVCELVHSGSIVLGEPRVYKFATSLDNKSWTHDCGRAHYYFKNYV